MNDDGPALGVGLLMGFAVALIVFSIANSGAKEMHKAEIQSMQKAAIERGAAEWKDENGKPVFTWKEISK